jgi:hypothetical protein
MNQEQIAFLRDLRQGQIEQIAEFGGSTILLSTVGYRCGEFFVFSGLREDFGVPTSVNLTAEEMASDVWLGLIMERFGLGTSDPTTDAPAD